MEERKEFICHRPYLYELGKGFPTRHGIMTVVDRERVCLDGRVFRKKYVLQCPRGHRYPVKEEYLKTGRLRTCKMCNHPTIAESDPEFATWFVDPAIPRQLPGGSHQHADFYCPRCGKIVRDKSIHNVHKRREVPCPYCTNGVSYPERYLMALLEQLQVPFVRQYSAQLPGAASRARYRYDFYDPERNLLIETHGQQHYEPGTFERVGGQSLEEIRKNDAEKEQYATRILKMRYLALDCRRSTESWIRREAEKKLSFYPLDTVDWKKVQQNAQKSVLLQIITLAREGYTQKQIGEMVHLSASVVCARLRQARRDGLYEGPPPRQPAPPKEKQRRTSSNPQPRPARQSRKERDEAAWKTRKAALEALPPPLVWLAEEPWDKTKATFFCKTCGRTTYCGIRTMLSRPQCPHCRKAETWQQKLSQRYGSAFAILENYQDADTPLRVRHDACGSEFSRTPTLLLAKGCPVCARRKRADASARTRRKAGEEKFLALLPEFERLGYPYAGETFQGYGKPNAFRCSHCGEIWWTTASSILQGRNHICCSRCKKKTPAVFEQEVRALTGNEYTVLGPYRTAHTPVKLRHRVCGLEYLVTPAHFLGSGRRCPVCSVSGKEATLSQCLAKVQKKYAVWEQTEAAKWREEIWNRKYQDLKIFYQREGHSDVPEGYRVDDYDLGCWLSDQKKAYRKGSLSRERVEKLEAVKVRWKRKEEDWYRAYGEIQKYLQENGWPRLEGASPEERRWYYWIWGQIERGREDKLTPEQKDLLNRIGIRWEYRGDLHFDAMCRLLQQFVEQHGHCIVPLTEGEGSEESLGSWAQRMRGQLAAGTLLPERARRLVELGLPENNQKAKFAAKLICLQQYYRIHGDLRIPQSYTEEGKPMGKWINTFRVQYRKGKLPPEQIAALESIGMIWDATRRTVK